MLPEGWYKDPYDPSVERWWTGTQWSFETRRPGVVPPRPVEVPQDSVWGPPSGQTVAFALTTPPRSKKWLVLGAVSVLLFATVALVAVRSLQTGPSYPATWEPRVQDIVSFVENERGHSFLHPVALKFMTTDEFEKSLTTSKDGLSDDDRKQLEDMTAMLRATGLYSSKDGSLLDQTNQLSSKNTAAYYSPSKKLIVVPFDGSKTDPLPLVVQGDLAHELTHALQDQLGYLATTKDTDRDAQRAVVEGDAQRVGQAWVDALSSSVRDQYDEQDQERSSSADADLSSVNKNLAALASSPYSLGKGLVNALFLHGGNTAVDTALQNASDGSLTIATLADPRRYDLSSAHKPSKVQDPSLPKGAEKLDASSMGPVFLYLMFAPATSVSNALSVVDAYDNDRALTYKLDDQVCVEASIVATTGDDTRTIYTVASQWAASRPAAAKAKVSEDGKTTNLSFCDPRSDAQDQASGGELGVLVRAELYSVFLKEDIAPDVAACAADKVARVIPPDYFSSDDLSDAQLDNVRSATTDALSVCTG